MSAGSNHAEHIIYAGHESFPYIQHSEGEQ